jgi:hypothetical protein
MLLGLLGLLVGATAATAEPAMTALPLSAVRLASGSGARASFEHSAHALNSEIYLRTSWIDSDLRRLLIGYRQVAQVARHGQWNH